MQVDEDFARLELLERADHGHALRQASAVDEAQRHEGRCAEDGVDGLVVVAATRRQAADRVQRLAVCPSGQPMRRDGPYSPILQAQATKGRKRRGVRVTPKVDCALGRRAAVP